MLELITPDMCIREINGTCECNQDKMLACGDYEPISEYNASYRDRLNLNEVKG